MKNRKFDFLLFFNDNIRYLTRIVRKFLVEFAALIKGKKFYCSALSGKSAYNIGINCDLTVSCNCRDYNGAGHIGDMNIDSFEDIFNSDTANRFRKKLASGKVPILVCVSCPELVMAPPELANHYQEYFDLPTKGIMVENTVVCNFRCTGCSRDTVNKIRYKKAMSLEDMHKVSLALKRNKINHIDFYNLGEPFCSPKVLEHLQIIRQYNPEIGIATSTNGIFINNDKKREAALLCNRIVFSIDGIDDQSINKYQRGGNFDISYQNMKSLVEYRDTHGKINSIIEWKYVLFNWNDKKNMILKAIELAKKANVDIISFWPTRYPLYGISWRYYIDGFFRSLGRPVGNRRVITINNS